MKKNIFYGSLILALPFLLAMGEKGIGIIFWGIVFRHLYGEHFANFFGWNERKVAE